MLLVLLQLGVVLDVRVGIAALEHHDVVVRLVAAELPALERVEVLRRVEHLGPVVDVRVVADDVAVDSGLVVVHVVEGQAVVVEGVEQPAAQQTIPRAVVKPHHRQRARRLSGSAPGARTRLVWSSGTEALHPIAERARPAKPASLCTTLMLGIFSRRRPAHNGEAAVKCRARPRTATSGQHRTRSSPHPTSRSTLPCRPNSCAPSTGRMPTVARCGPPRRHRRDTR